MAQSQLSQRSKHKRFWQVLPSGYQQFETMNLGEAYIVDLHHKTCSCRLWQLNGYGCVHSVATICFLNHKLEDHVSHWFKADKYKDSYSSPILPQNGSNMWPETEYTPVIPPLNRRMPGRPSIKRKKDASERVAKHRVSKAGKSVKCGICKVAGHNKVTCPQKERPAQEVPVQDGPSNELPTPTGDAGTSGTKSKKRGRPVKYATQDVPSTSGTKAKKGSKGQLKQPPKNQT